MKYFPDLKIFATFPEISKISIVNPIENIGNLGNFEILKSGCARDFGAARQISEIPEFPEPGCLHRRWEAVEPPEASKIVIDVF